MPHESEIELSLVCPVHNQADHVEAVLKSYISTIESMGRTFEIIPVLNACRDESADIVEKVFGEDERVRPINTETPGWGNAVIVGIDAARGQQICYTNSSRTTGEELVAVIDAHDSTARVLTKAQREARRPWYRIIGSFLYNTEALLLFGIRAKDVNGTPKIIAREHMQDIKLQERGDFVDLELLFLCRRRKIDVKNVPMPARERLGGQSTTGMKTAVRLLTGAPMRRFDWLMKGHR